ncbi:MAG: hypothetical protein EA402_00265 [Planctomycetota bacterium]|nr:MAG: hypothetical protein EA402_00265 [Planctomycetota bacterium]
MKRIFTLVLLLTTVAVGLAEETQRSRAFFNPRVSTRDIALNQIVTITFTTLRPQVEEVDPEATVRAALVQPAASESWRLWREPRVEVDPKIGTLRIHIALLPRQTGTLELPEIPVRWLTGNQMARFGQVQVASSLAHGSSRLALSGDHQRVAGIEWGAPYEEVLGALNRPMGEADVSGELVVRADNGMELIIRGGRLAAARIRAPQVSFSQARAAFHERWGDSLPTQAEQTLLWMQGWIRIEATPLPGASSGTLLTLTHEGIESRISRSLVESSVFNLLDGGNPPAAAAPAAPAAAAPVTRDDTAEPPSRGDPPAAERGTPPPAAFDPQAEFERQMQRALEEEQRNRR